jgi:hypothetical protein
LMMTKRKHTSTLALFFHNAERARITKQSLGLESAFLAIHYSNVSFR